MTNPIFSTHADGCWSWGRKHYECALRQIESLTRERDALAERLSVAEELFASECEDPVNNLDAYLWYHGERHKKLAEDAGKMKKHRVLDLYLADEYDKDVYLASDVDARIAELEKALREVREHVRDLECYECVVCINRALEQLTRGRCGGW